MPASPVTARVLAIRLLRYLGVTSLDPTTPANQAFPIEPTDLDDVIGVMNSALQEYFELSPSEVREANLGAYLNAPTNATLSVTQGSSVITSFTGYASWMLGCTIRLFGDTQDNEVTSQTLLARPFMGATSGSVAATVFGDAVQLDATVGKVFDPVSVPNQSPLLPATSRMEFCHMAGYPLVTGPWGGSYGGSYYPFFWWVQKPISRPLTWFLESAYTSNLAYVPRRIRVAPMPNAAYSLSYRAGLNALRLQATDVDTGDHTTDPMTLLPISDTDVESILMRICAKGMTMLPTFKNAGAVQGIEDAYKRAVSTMQNIRGQGSVERGNYVC